MKPEQSSHPNIDVKALRDKLPEGPGVYLFKDSSGRIIYVGKAKNLRKRVLSYFKKTDDLTQKTRLMMSRAKGVDTILTETENEAFILEDTLIKKHMPRYNVVLRDDKRYPCLRLDLRKKYPRLQIVRRIKKDGALYFGPFSSAGSVRKTVKLIETIFPLRKCRGNNPPKRSRPCLNYQLGRCLGPCARDVTFEIYGELVEQVRLFLEGRNQELQDRLIAEMKEASETLQFEKAAKIRDRVQAIGRTIERQNVVSSTLEDRDVIGLARKEELFQVVNLHVRNGALAGSRGYLFRERDSSISEVMEAFIKQHYAEKTFIPKTILISHSIEGLGAVQDWISELAGRKITIRRPLRGEKKRLISMAEANAENLLKAQAVRLEDPMEQIRIALRFEERPSTIEGMDISNLQGSSAVGTIVRFEDGRPDKSGYRNFRIRDVEGIDDYAMMAEIVARRLSKGDWPDLFLVDGGKAHLASVKRVLDDAVGDMGPYLLAIAKRDDKLGETADKIFVQNRKNPLSLGPDHPVLLFLMRVRDETHRRAIAYHRKIRSKKMTSSVLDKVPGIGPKRKMALLSRFGSVEAIKRLSSEELADFPGISLKRAGAILEALRGK
jgi:excinuclease ABC subunit C